MIYILIGTDKLTGAKDFLGYYDDRSVAESLVKSLSIAMFNTYSNIDVITARNDGQLDVQELVLKAAYQAVNATKERLVFEYGGSLISNGKRAVLEKNKNGDDMTFVDVDVNLGPSSLPQPDLADGKKIAQNNVPVSPGGNNLRSLALKTGPQDSDVATSAGSALTVAGDQQKTYTLKFLVLVCLLAAGIGAGSFWIVLALV